MADLRATELVRAMDEARKYWSLNCDHGSHAKCTGWRFTGSPTRHSAKPCQCPCHKEAQQ